MNKLNKEQLNEVKARVKFKMNDVKDWLKNQKGLSWNSAFQSGNQKYQHYFEAFEMLEKEINKEIEMPLPRENMSEVDYKRIRNEYVEKLSDAFELHRKPELYRKKINTIVRIVEEMLEK